MRRIQFYERFDYFIYFCFRDRDSALEDDLAPNLIVLSVIPWFHGFGCITVIASMLHRWRVVLLPKFGEISFLEAIQVRLYSTYLLRTRT